MASKLTIGISGVASGNVTLAGSTSGTVAIEAAAAASTSGFTITNTGAVKVTFTGSSTQNGVTWDVAGGGKAWFVYCDATGWAIYNNTDGAEAIRSSNARAIKFAAYGAGTATFDASGNITSVSDERLKTGIRRFKSGLKELLNLKPILYRWKKKSGLETEHTYAGFSAQDVQSSIPEAAGMNPDGTLTLQDRALMAAMVNAIQELKAEIDALKRK